jgi:hypothetical protein
MLAKAGKEMAQAFLSYARENKDFAEVLATQLERSGFEIWWDHEIPAGVDFRANLDIHLKSSDCIIVCWSKAAVRSRWVIEEAEDGAARGILIPVLCEDAEIPRGFRSFQTIDLTDWDGQQTHEEFETLLSAVSEKCRAPSKKIVPRYSARSAYHVSLKRNASRNTSIMAVGTVLFLLFSVFDLFEADGGLLENRIRLIVVAILMLLGSATWIVRNERFISWLMCFNLIVIGIAVVVVDYHFNDPVLGLDKVSNGPLNFALLFVVGIGLGAISRAAAAVVVVVNVLMYSLSLVYWTHASAVFIAGCDLNLSLIGATMCIAKKVKL